MKSLLFFFSFYFIWLCSSAQEPRLVIPVGHVKPITNTCFSPDGHLVATTSEDQTIKIWDPVSGRLIKTFFGHKGIITDLEFSPKGNYLLSSSKEDGSNRIWNLSTGLEDISVVRMFYPDRQVIFSNDDKLAVTMQTQSLALWDLHTGVLIDSFISKKSDGDFRYFTAAAFSNDNKQIAGYDYKDHFVVIWNRSSGTASKKFKVETQYGMLDISFSKDNKRLIFISPVQCEVADIASGKMIFTSKLYSNGIAQPQLFADGNFLFTSDIEHPFRIVNNDTIMNEDDTRYEYHPSILNLKTFTTTQLKGARPRGSILGMKTDETGKWMMVLTDDTLVIYKLVNNSLVRYAAIRGDSLVFGNAYNHSAISRGGKYILSTDRYDVPSLFDNYGKLLKRLNGSIGFDSLQYFSEDGNSIFTGRGNTEKYSWDIRTGKISPRFDTAQTIINDRKKINPNNFLSYDTLKKQWRVRENKNASALQGETATFLQAIPSNNGKYIFTYNAGDSTLKTWDSKTGVMLYRVKSKLGEFNQPVLSNDDRFIALMVSNFSMQIDLMWANLQKEIDGDTSLRGIEYNFPNEVRVLELASGKELLYLQDSLPAAKETLMSFSSGSKYFSLSSFTLHIWETVSWKTVLDAENDCVKSTETFPGEPDWAISPDGKLIAVSCYNNATVYSTETNKKLYSLPAAVTFASFSDDGQRILTESDNRELKIWSTGNGALLYTYYAFEKGDWLVTDRYDRYDGSEAARKKLYYACGNEFIDLDQFKDQLWVPNLAERIMQGDSINAPKLSDLHICGLTPLIENRDSWHFIITSRRGGLGVTVLYINGIEAKRYAPAALKKINNVYELALTKEELTPFFISGKENKVTVKAFTADNTISSRGLVLNPTSDNQQAISPNLYAVMVGVSDYKGAELDLKYAAKDAGDLSHAIAIAAKKLLNTDTAQHVFMYNLVTDKERYRLPEKNSIQQVLQEIGKKARPNDILLLFFAGHGLMAGSGEKKQFYFLTADASMATVNDLVAAVGISTSELAEWMKPQNIKAQKRVMIFDACNSGQAINDFVKIGNQEQGYTAARNDDRAQLIKAVDKLNEKSGLFILSASATDQSAYEMGKYAQGLLTYALLKAIKEQPDILDENKFLDLSRWFNAAEKTVNDLSRESGERQQPQIVSNVNFNIGIVDADVISSIVLPKEPPVFTSSNFHNEDPAADGDNLDISRLINQRLKELSHAGAENKISYNDNSSSSDAWSLGGRYSVKDEEITIQVSIKKNNLTMERFEEKGTISNIKALVEKVVGRGIEGEIRVLK